MMAMREDGRTVGSVSGGCIEDDLIFRYSNLYATGETPKSGATVVRYGVTTDEAHRFGLPCGGTLELVLEFEPLREALDELVQRLEEGELMRRILQLSTNSVRLEYASSSGTLQFDGETLINTIGPEYRMLLIGAGVLTEYVCTMALFCGFSVTVCDPRVEYLDTWSISGVHKTTEMPDDAVLAFRPDQRSCIIALTHDPKLDDLALLEAMHSSAFYVGAIGSRRNSCARHARMKTHFGETDLSLKRLRGPIGIYIGSKTPAEIAVSAMAEVLAIKNEISLPNNFSVAFSKQKLET